MNNIKVTDSDILDLLNLYTNRSKDLLSLLKNEKCGLTGGSCLYLFYKSLKYKNLWNINDLDLVCSSKTTNKIIELLKNEIKSVKTFNDIKVRQIVFKNNKKCDVFLFDNKEINHDNFFSFKKFDINICENLLTFTNNTITTKVFNDIINKNVIRNKFKPDTFNESRTASRIKKYKSRLSNLIK